jgi:hypothetical protein
MLQIAIPQFAILQFAIPQFTIPQYHYQYQPPLFDNFFSLKYLLKQAKKCRTVE